LFISHSWDHSGSYDSLNKLLKERSYFDFKNYSVPKDDPVHTNGTDQQLWEAIAQKMSFCHVVLILAGVYSTYSKSINMEIDIAKDGFSITKPILAIEPWGSERTSAIVKDNADRVVGWHTESVVEAIRELAG